MAPSSAMNANSRPGESFGTQLTGSALRPNPPYNLLLPAHGRSERLVRHRTSLGMTQGEAPKRLGVGSGTLARWERGEREPTGVLLGRVERFLDEAEAGLEARRVG